MTKLTENDERILAAAHEGMDRYRVALSILARGESSPYMTEELKAQIAEAKKRLEPYTIAGRAKQAESRK